MLGKAGEALCDSLFNLCRNRASFALRYKEEELPR